MAKRKKNRESSSDSSEAELSDQAPSKRKQVTVGEVDDELVGKTELQIESIIFERKEAERKRNEEASFLKARKTALDSPKSEPDSPKKRVTKKTLVFGSDSDDSDVSDVSDDESINQRDAKRVTKQMSYSDDDSNDQVENVALSKTVELRDLISMQLTRNVLLQWDSAPYFEECIGGYVRLLIGQSKKSNEQVYRICEIVHVEQCEPYLVDNVSVEHALILKHGKSEGRWKLDRISNSVFSYSEMDFLESSMKDNFRLPIMRDVKRFEKRIQSKVHDYVLSHEEIDLKIQKSKLRRKTAANLASEKTAINRKIELAKEMNDEELIRELEMELEEVLEAILKKKERVSALHSGLANINARNVKENLGRVIEKKSEKSANEWNPFARKPTRPVILWSTLAPGQSNDDIQVEQPQKVIKRITVSQKPEVVSKSEVPTTTPSKTKKWAINRPKPTGAKKMSLAEYMQKINT